MTVVPRTFFGAFILAYAAKIIALVTPKQIIELASRPMIVQFLIRFELLLLNWLACLRLAKAVDYYFQRQSKTLQKQSKNKISSQHETNTTVGSYYLLITACQFHIPFYSSRLLPNTFALLLITNAYADWFHGNYHRTAMYLVFATAIFRCDMMLLLFTVGLSMLIRRQLTIIQAISIGVYTGICSLIMTVPLDSLLWGRLIWPELEVWWFNTVDNRSSEWGKMVWHWYFSRALPKGLMATAFLVPLAFLRLPELVDRLTMKNANDNNSKRFFDWRLFPYILPVFGFVVLYSFLPHKEIRFIFPAIPMFNVCSAYGMNRLHRAAFSNSTTRKNRLHLIRTAMYLFGIGSIALTAVASLIFLRMSIENYPGGEALLRLRGHLLDTVPRHNDGQLKWNDIHVHVDVAAAMTGISLFGQRHASIRQIGKDDQYEGPFIINKSGFEEENKLAEDISFTHLLTERPEVDGYHRIGVIKGYPRLAIRNLRIETQNAIFVHEKDDMDHDYD